MLLILASAAVSREREPFSDKFRARLAADPSTASEERVILESLSALGRQLDKSVTADEVASEIGAKIGEILAQITRADALLRADFSAIRAEFESTRGAVPGLIAETKREILADIRQFHERLNGSLRGLGEAVAAAQDSWLDSSVEGIYDLAAFFDNASLRRVVVFFVAVQIVIVQAMLRIRQIDRYLLSRASAPQRQPALEAIA
jgi:hypothetical protein